MAVGGVRDWRLVTGGWGVAVGCVVGARVGVTAARATGVGSADGRWQPARSRKNRAVTQAQVRFVVCCIGANFNPQSAVFGW